MPARAAAALTRVLRASSPPSFSKTLQTEPAFCSPLLAPHDSTAHATGALKRFGKKIREKKLSYKKYWSATLPLSWQTRSRQSWKRHRHSFPPSSLSRMQRDTALRWPELETVKSLSRNAEMELNPKGSEHLRPEWTLQRPPPVAINILYIRAISYILVS